MVTMSNKIAVLLEVLRQEVARRLAVGCGKATEEVVLRHPGRRGQGFEVERLRVVAVGKIARPAKMYQERFRYAGHLRRVSDHASSKCGRR